MGGANTEAPTLEAEERLVEQNEAVNLPEKPELPASLDAALDTFIEKLDLEQPGPAEFALGSALAATAERFGPSEAEILLSRFDEELTAQFFENLIDSGAIPQNPTMNNLLAGDVNSQAAQFILENLAAQSASGAFITMQATRRDTSSQEERKRERKAQTLSEAAAFAQMQAITADLNILQQQVTNTMEALQGLFVEIEAAELAFDTTKAQMQAEEQALNENISENNTITQELHAAGFATITLGDILDHTPEQLPERFAALINDIEDEKVKAALAERAFIVERDADGSLFVELGRGERLELTEAMKADIQTVIVVAHAARAGSDTPSFRTDTEAGGKPLEAYHANQREFINGVESYANAEDAHNVARENYENLQDQAQDIIKQLKDYRAQTEAYDVRIALMKEAGQDVTTLKVQQETIYNQITEANIKLGELQNRMAEKLNGATSRIPEQELTSTTPIDLNTSLNTSLLDTGLSLSSGLSSSSLLAPRFSDLDFSTINLNTLDYSTLDFTTTDFSTLNFNSLTSDFASNDSLSLGLDGMTSSLMPSYLAYDMSYNFYDYDFFDLDLDTIDFSAIDFDDTFFTDTQALLASIDTGTIQSELDSLNADIDEIVNSVIAEEELPEGIDRAALEEAIRLDLEWSAENKACRPVEHTNVGKLLAAEGAEAFMTQMSQPGMTVMGMPLGGIFNGAAAMSEHTALAQSLSMAVDQAGADGRGDRLIEAQKRLQEIEGGEQSTTVAGAAAESLTLESPSLDEITREAKLANEARVYADQVRANGVVTERDLEDAFPGLSADEMDLVKAEMDAEGIEVRLEEPVAGVEEPTPTVVSNASVGVSNTRSPYEPAAMTPGG